MAGWFSSIRLETFGTQVSEFTHTLGKSATKMGEDIQQKVTTLTAFDLEGIGKVIQEAENGIISEETKIKQEQAGIRQSEIKILPWETRMEQKSILSQGLMEKVLSLSLEESNFTTAPPVDGPISQATEESPQGKEDNDETRHEDETSTSASPEFHLDRHINVAVKMLSLDPNLAKVHARLISHMPEQLFWYHYFSRVALLRKEVGLEPLCEDLSKDVSGTVTSEEYDKVSHGDAQSMSSPFEQPTEVDHKSDDARAGDDDFSDLGDLDDLDGASDTSIDATLEAEIAAELGEG
ncbi:unnamed protein product [Ascophyllum nodosum]